MPPLANTSSISELYQNKYPRLLVEMVLAREAQSFVTNQK